MTERMPNEPDVRPNEAPPRLWVYIDALSAELAKALEGAEALSRMVTHWREQAKDARLEAENYRRVAKLCSLGHEQAEQRATDLTQAVASARNSS